MANLNPEPIPIISVHGVRFLTRQGNIYRVDDNGSRTTDGLFLGLLTDLPNRVNSLGNLKSGSIVINEFKLVFNNPINKSGNRVFQEDIDLLESHIINVELYEVIGDEDYIRDFSNWNLIIKARIKNPIAHNVSGLDQDKVTVTLSTALTGFKDASVKLDVGRGALSTVIPKVLGELTVPCFYVGTDSTYYYYKVCQGPIGRFINISINGSLNLGLPAVDKMENTGYFRLPINIYGNLLYEDNLEDNIVTARIDGYINPLLDNGNFSDRFILPFGENLPVGWSATNGSIADNGDGTSRLTASGAGVYIDNTTTLNGFGTRFIRLRYKRVSGTAIGDIILYWGSTSRTAPIIHHNIILGVVDTGTGWVDITVNIDTLLAQEDNFFKKPKDMWLEGRYTELRLVFGTGVDIVVDIEYLKFSEGYLTKFCSNQIKDLLISDTEELGNLLTSSLGYTPFYGPHVTTTLPGGADVRVSADYGEMPPLVLGFKYDPNLAFNGNYIICRGDKNIVEDGEGYALHTGVEYDALVLPSNTEFIFSVRHTLDRALPLRYPIRCYITVGIHNSIGGLISVLDKNGIFKIGRAHV